VTVTAPAGVVFVQALPANFEVVQLNTMYFTANGQYYVPCGEGAAIGAAVGAGAGGVATAASSVAPENAVTLKVTLQAMPEGVSYPGTIVFALPKRQLEVKITKSNYQKIAQ
jgi:hypothetical protein